MKISSAFSKEDDSKKVGADLKDQIEEELDNPDLVYVFTSSTHADEDLLSSLSQRFSEAAIIGASTGGEIYGADVDTGNAVALALEGDLEVGVGVGQDISEDERKAGMTAAGKALTNLGKDYHITSELHREGIEWEKKHPVTFSVFSTALTGNGSEVMRGVKDVLGEAARLSGGIAGDDWKLDETYVYHNGEVLTDAIVVAALESENSIAHGIKHGLSATEHTYEVTSSEANVVNELDGEPAADAYEDVFGTKGRTANYIMTKPLGIEMGEKEPRARDPLDVDDETGSITFAAEIKEGSLVYILESPPEDVIDAARTAAEKAVEQAGNPDPSEIKGVILHDCVCRWNCLKDNETRQEEVEAVKEVVGEETEVVGWYTYGEIALPRANAGVHNQTMVLQIFTE